MVAETELPPTRRRAGLRLSGRLFLHSRLPDQRDVLARPTSETEDGLSLGTFGLASGDRIASGSKMVAGQPRVLHLCPGSRISPKRTRLWNPGMTVLRWFVSSPARRGTLGWVSRRTVPTEEGVNRGGIESFYAVSSLSPLSACRSAISRK